LVSLDVYESFLKELIVNAEIVNFAELFKELPKEDRDDVENGLIENIVDALTLIDFAHLRHTFVKEIKNKSLKKSLSWYQC